MANDRDHNDQPQPGTGIAEHPGRERNEQFNEVSELSLEERIAAADRIGIPVESVSDAAATGAVSGRDDGAGVSGDRMEEESTGEETSQ